MNTATNNGFFEIGDMVETCIYVADSAGGFTNRERFTAELVSLDGETAVVLDDEGWEIKVQVKDCWLAA